MVRYEYVRLLVDIDALSELNRYGAGGWHVVATEEMTGKHPFYVLLERPLPEQKSSV